MTMRIDRCLYCGCGLEMKATGRPRRYCSSRCRMAHKRREERQQQMASATMGAPPGRRQHPKPSVTDLVGLPKDPDEAVVAAVMQARAASAALGLAGAVARPQLNWRCDRLAQLIADGLHRYFPSE